MDIVIIGIALMGSFGTALLLQKAMLRLFLWALAGRRTS
jgi:hypothetical protein